MLAHTDGLMRVAVRGCRDAVEFIEGPDGLWLSDSGEPVLLGSPLVQRPIPESLDEFICPPDTLTRVLAGEMACGALTLEASPVA